MEKLTLENIAEGSLEQQFQATYPQILQALKTAFGASLVIAGDILQ